MNKPTFALASTILITTAAAAVWYQYNTDTAIWFMVGFLYSEILTYSLSYSQTDEITEGGASG